MSDSDGQGNKRARVQNGGLVFVACILIGSGVGLAVDEVAVGSLIGTGVGFLLMALIGRR